MKKLALRLVSFAAPLVLTATAFAQESAAEKEAVAIAGRALAAGRTKLDVLLLGKNQVAEAITVLHAAPGQQRGKPGSQYRFEANLGAEKHRACQVESNAIRIQAVGVISPALLEPLEHVPLALG